MRDPSKSSRCLFSAPFDFLDGVADDFRSYITTEFQQIRHARELSHCPDVVAWVPNPGQLFVIGTEALSYFPYLKVIVTPSTGRNHIDLQACSSRGVSVYSLLDGKEALEKIAASAEFTFLLLLNTLRRLDVAMEEVTARRMRSREDLLRGHELAGKRVGLVGLGRIGRRLRRYCEAFDARVAYCDPYVDDRSLPRLPLRELFAASNALCVCCTLSDETLGMIDYDILRRLHHGASFLNTSRGEIVVEEDLVRVLGERPDIRVGLDVVCGEVTNRHHASPLLAYHDSGRIVVTPHVAGATVESQTKAARAALDILKRVLPTVAACK